MNASPSSFDGGRFIADKSAWARARHEAVKPAWSEAMAEGRLLTCQVTRLEILYSARSAAEFTDLERELAELEDLPVTSDVCELAVTALRALSARSAGYHRVHIPDALIAACAMENKVGVLHYDRHFDQLSEVLEFESRWLAQPGTIP